MFARSCRKSSEASAGNISERRFIEKTILMVEIKTRKKAIFEHLKQIQDNFG